MTSRSYNKVTRLNNGPNLLSHELHNEDIRRRITQPALDIVIILRGLVQTVKHDPVSQPIYAAIHQHKGTREAKSMLVEHTVSFERTRRRRSCRIVPPTPLVRSRLLRMVLCSPPHSLLHPARQTIELGVRDIIL